MARAFASGEVVGEWSLNSLLGSGGNADVWKAKHPTLGELALKILKVRNPDKEPYRRFRAEVEVLSGLGDTEGILPLVASDLPERPSRTTPAWLAMPVADSLRAQLQGKSLDKTVEAIAEAARALEQLHSRRIFHRDIKPANLYIYKGRCCVGDFGLVDYPGKSALTAEGKKLGPLYYLAPEMLNDARIAEGGPADVYSLAKTLWVLATGQTFPVPGEQRLDVAALGISSYCDSSRANILDVLLARATRHEPSSRPSMLAFAEELGAWLNPHEYPKPPLEQVAKVFSRVLQPEVDEQKRIRILKDNAERLATDLRTNLKEWMSELSNKLYAELDAGSIGRVSFREKTNIAFSGAGPAKTGEVILSSGASVSLVATQATLISAIGVRALANGMAQVAAVHLAESGMEKNVIWRDTCDVHVGSATCENMSKKLLAALAERWPTAMERVSSR
jgi:serine/threonine protein kinase